MNWHHTQFDTLRHFTHCWIWSFKSFGHWSWGGHISTILDHLGLRYGEPLYGLIWKWWAPSAPPTPLTHMVIIVLLCMDCKLTDYLTRTGWPLTEMVPHTKNDEHDWENIFPKAALETVLKLHISIIIANSLYSYTSSKFLAHRDFFLKLLTSFFWCFKSLCKIMRLSPKK